MPRVGVPRGVECLEGLVADLEVIVRDDRTDRTDVGRRPAVAAGVGIYVEHLAGDILPLLGCRMNAIDRARGHARRVFAAATGDHVRHHFAYQVDGWNIRYTLIPCYPDIIVGIIFGPPPLHHSERCSLI